MKANKDKENVQNGEEQEPVFSERVEKTFKLIMRIMSSIIGVAIAAILIFPVFEIHWLDVLTTQILRAGLISLVLVLLIELFSRRVKLLISRIIKA